MYSNDPLKYSLVDKKYIYIYVFSTNICVLELLEGKSCVRPNGPECLVTQKSYTLYMARVCVSIQSSCVFI